MMKLTILQFEVITQNRIYHGKKEGKT